MFDMLVSFVLVITWLLAVHVLVADWQARRRGRELDQLIARVQATPGVPVSSPSGFTVTAHSGRDW